MLVSLNKVVVADDDTNAAICEKLEGRFVQEIMAMPISPVLSHTTLSEKNW